MKTCIVIPARLMSTRLPEKLLLAETGKPLIQHTYEAASKSSLAESVFVATDSEKILSVVEAFGGKAVMTDPNHESGTDRIAEFAEVHPEFDMLVNVQGDEPEISADSIDAAIRLLSNHSEQGIATLACPVQNSDYLQDASCVKVVLDKNQRALYFSRSNIPFDRNLPGAPTTSHFQHIGLYAYRREFLMEFAKMPVGRLEQIEKLEQLRVLESGHSIMVAIVDSVAPGIDTQEDYSAFVRRQDNC